MIGEDDRLLWLLLGTSKDHLCDQLGSSSMRCGLRCPLRNLVNEQREPIYDLAAPLSDQIEELSEQGLGHV